MSADCLWGTRARSVLASAMVTCALMGGASLTGSDGALIAAAAPLAAGAGLPSIPSLPVSYRLDIPGGGEIFPAFASGGPTEYWPVAILTLKNTSSRPLTETVSAEIHDWSHSTAQTVVLGPNETRTLRLNPELVAQAFENNEMRQATLEVHATLLGTTLGFDETRLVYIHSASDFYWGNNFANAHFIARWVTPHDPAVMQLVSSARNFMPRGRLAGYSLPRRGAPAEVANQVQDEARAVFAAMQRLGVSYVDSIGTFGHLTSRTERVRLPRETLTMNGANCIDISVAFASAMENLGMDPVIVLAPGHAFTGVKLGRGSSQILYLDLTVLPDGTFSQAQARAHHWLASTRKTDITLIDIAAARSRQIYPLPTIAQKM